MLVKKRLHIGYYLSADTKWYLNVLESRLVFLYDSLHHPQSNLQPLLGFCLGLDLPLQQQVLHPILLLNVQKGLGVLPLQPVVLILSLRDTSYSFKKALLCFLGVSLPCSVLYRF